MTKPQSPFGLRLSPELRAIVAKRAQVNGRSLNREICTILKDVMLADLEKQRTHECTQAPNRDLAESIR